MRCNINVCLTVIRKLNYPCLRKFRWFAANVTRESKIGCMNDADKCPFKELFIRQHSSFRFQKLILLDLKTMLDFKDYFQSILKREILLLLYTEGGFKGRKALFEQKADNVFVFNQDQVVSVTFFKKRHLQSYFNENL